MSRNPGVENGDERTRRPSHGPMIIEVTNKYQTGEVISGWFTFYFKRTTSTEDYDGSEKVDLRHLAIPSGEKLVFQPRRHGCVSAFAGEVIVKLGSQIVAVDPLKRKDRAGECWSSYKCDAGR